MSSMTRFARTGGTLLAICAAALAGCAARTNVSTTAATPAQFTHVYITAQAVWFNTTANAGPDDAGWAKFALKIPVTVDLVTESNGTLGEIANDLRVAPGTYNTILILPVDAATGPTTSAQAVGATYNQEADFVDASGVPHQVPLVIPNPEKGIIVPGANALTVPVGGSTSGGLPIGAGAGTFGNTGFGNNGFGNNGFGNNGFGNNGFGNNGFGNNGFGNNGFGNTNNNFDPNTTNNAQTLFGSPTTINPVTNTTTTPTNNTLTVSFASTFDGNRDLHTFSYSSANLPGVLLSSNPASTNLATTGGITGTLSLTSLTSLAPITHPSGRMDIQACAESLSADGTHHVVVACAPVQTDGAFTIYPLASNSRNPVSYDVVIHGPHIHTIIIKGVVVTTTTPTTTPAATTAGSVATTTASGAVSIGTIIPKPAVQFPVSATASASGLPAGAVVTFYQTLGGSGSVPYAIDEVAIDPFNSALLQTNENLSASVIDSGTFSSNGGTITITSSQPVEGAGTYSVAATAPFYADGYPSAHSTAKAPDTTQGNNAADATTAVAVTVPALTPSNGSATGTINATIAPSSPGKYDRGELIVSRNGAVVGSARLDGAPVSTGQAVQVAGLPTGASYYLSVIVWTSGQVSAQNPLFTYESVTTPVNLTGSSADATVTIN